MANQRLQSYAIEMVMQARDETKAAFDSAQANAQTFMQNFAVQGLRAATAARIATLGVEALTAVMRIAKGDWDAVHETMKRMPLGIGAFHSALLELKETFVDLGETAKESAERVEGHVRWQAAKANVEALTQATRTHIAVMQAETFEGQRIAAAAAADEKRRKQMETWTKEGLFRELIPAKKTPVFSHFNVMGQPVMKEGKEIPASEKPVWPVSVSVALKEMAQEAYEAQRLIDVAERRAADEKRKTAADQAKELGEQGRRAFEAKSSMLRQIAAREYGATAEDFGIRLRALDDFYADQRTRWKDHADVMAALQDAYAAERAAAFLAEQQKLADEWDEAWVKEGKAPAELSGLAGRATVPALVSRFLTGGAAANPVQQSNKHLARIAETLDRMERKPGLDVTVEN
jgi:hypothetical protein